MRKKIPEEDNLNKVLIHNITVKVPPKKRNITVKGAYLLHSGEIFYI
jgi:hypothetical protein